MKELHSAIVETGRMLQDASGSGCDAYEAVLRTHLHHLINIAVGKLEREMEGFTDSPISYHLPQETSETSTAGGNTQSQLPQDSLGKISDLPASLILSDGDSFVAGEARKAVPLQRVGLIPQDNAEAMAAAVDYADGWRPWSGGDCPHDGAVKIRLRNGSVSKGPGSRFYWVHGGSDFVRGLEIVAWRPA